MKKIIPYLILIMSALQLQNCRPNDEAEDLSSSHSPVTKRMEKLSDVDPDPPIKDGQDWKYEQP